MRGDIHIYMAAAAASDDMDISHWEAVFWHVLCGNWLTCDTYKCVVACDVYMAAAGADEDVEMSDTVWPTTVALLRNILEFCRHTTQLHIQDEAELRKELEQISGIFMPPDDVKWPFGLKGVIFDFCYNFLHLNGNIKLYTQAYQFKTKLDKATFVQYVQYMVIENILLPLLQQCRDKMVLYIDCLARPEVNHPYLAAWKGRIESQYESLLTYKATIKSPSNHEEYSGRFVQFIWEEALQMYVSAVIAEDNNVHEWREVLKLIMPHGNNFCAFLTEQVERKLTKRQEQALCLWSRYIDNLCLNLCLEGSAAITEKSDLNPAVLGTNQAFIQICWNCLITFDWNEMDIYGNASKLWREALAAFGFSEPLDTLKEKMPAHEIQCPQDYNEKKWWGLYVISTRAYGTFGMEEDDFKEWIRLAQTKLREPILLQSPEAIHENMVRREFAAPVLDFATKCGGPINEGLQQLRAAIAEAAVPIPEGVFISVNRYADIDNSPEKLGLRPTTFLANITAFPGAPLRTLILRPGTLVVFGILVNSEFSELELLVVDGVTTNDPYNVYHIDQRPKGTTFKTLKLKF